MKTRMKHKNLVKYLICLSFLFPSLVGCSKDDKEGYPIMGRYFVCAINGEKYEIRESFSLYSYIQPLIWYNGQTSFTFYSTCARKTDKDNYKIYTLNFNLVLDSPIEIGEKYKIKPIEDLSYMVVKEDIGSAYDKISNCYIPYEEILPSDPNVLPAYEWVKTSLCYGSGFVEFKEVRDKWVLGTVDFKIPYPKDEYNAPQVLEIKGQFYSDMRE